MYLINVCMQLCLEIHETCLELMEISMIMVH